MNTRNRCAFTLAVLFLAGLAITHEGLAFSLSRASQTTLVPQGGVLTIPVSGINDGKAHYFNVKADDGIMVSFFTVKSADGIIRAAIDACDVCYRSGKGYVQDGDVMVCTNCKMRFATNRINEVKGGCNPAPLTRVMDKDSLIIRMADINANSWYCEFKK